MDYEITRHSYEETVRRLAAAGLDSIPGAGAEILDDEVRDIIGFRKDRSDVMDLEAMERLIRSAGYEPRRRNTRYEFAATSPRPEAPRKAARA